MAQNPALDQFRAKTTMAGVCSRFAFATATTIEDMKNCSKNENTANSTDFWLAVWKKWCLEKKITDEIENYEPAELNDLLEHFYAEVKNKQGEHYEPESLKVMMASLDRHLKNKGYTLSIVRDREFSSSKQVLEGKRNSFAWLAMAGAQTKLDKYQRRKKKLSGRAENSEVITQNL